MLELFRGLCVGGKEKIDDALKALFLAARLSQRKVLARPFPFVERELFHVRDWRHEYPSANLKRWLGIAQRPGFKAEFASGSVVGMNLDKIEPLFQLIKAQHHKAVEWMLDHIHPRWRTERVESGSPLPEDKREEIKRRFPVERWKRDTTEALLETMGFGRTSENIDLLSKGCDAYLMFTVNLLRDSMIGSYRIEDHPNDFHDGLQLLYLSRTSFCVVTDDSRMIKRVGRSIQSSRIITVDQFLCSSS